MNNVKNLKKHKKLFVKILLYTSVSVVSLLAILFLGACFWIRYEVVKNCNEAKRQYRGDCVIALSARVADENANFRSRNYAIWSLGQLGGSRALPVLTHFYTGNIPAREPYNDVISQYELKKAIALTKGDPNLTAPFWRYGVE